MWPRGGDALNEVLRHCAVFNLTFRGLRSAFGVGFALGLILSTTGAAAELEPWAPRANCSVSPRGGGGLVPAAQDALKRIGAEHRITQSFNPIPAASNYHGKDQTIDGRPLTAAVDLSVNCLGENEIKQFLSALAEAGFAAWYRQDGVDGWKGAKHVHAVFAAEPLKPQLKGQVQSWLDGRTGLVGNARYKYWQPSDSQKQAVAKVYRDSKAAK